MKVEKYTPITPTPKSKRHQNPTLSIDETSNSTSPLTLSKSKISGLASELAHFLLDPSPKEHLQKSDKQIQSKELNPFDKAFRAKNTQNALKRVTEAIKMILSNTPEYRWNKALIAVKASYYGGYIPQNYICCCALIKKLLDQPSAYQIDDPRSSGLSESYSELYQLINNALGITSPTQHIDRKSILLPSSSHRPSLIPRLIINDATAHIPKNTTLPSQMIHTSPQGDILGEPNFSSRFWRGGIPN